MFKKLDWTKGEDSLYSFLINQRSIHIIVVALTGLVVFYNATQYGKANTGLSDTNKTIIASLVSSEFGTDEENQLVEEFLDQESTVSPTMQSYLDGLSLQGKDMIDTKQDEFEQEQKDEEFQTINDGDAIVRRDQVQIEKTKRPRESIVYYSVEQGDTVSSIAEKFEITIASILWENNLTAYSVIRPGDKLTILPFSGIAHKVAKGETMAKIAKLYGIDADKIAEVNEAVLASGLQTGIKLLIPGGKKLYSGEVISRPSTNSLGQAGRQDNISDRKYPNAKRTTGSKLNWPAVGYRITQYYSWRHHAIDIANKIGTPLFAADDGIVQEIGWGRGYGNQIVLNHGNGMLTRYAHMSKFYVKKGEKVTKGETLGEMGSTGWSTGPHIHFEVIVKGVKYNPLNYLR